MRIFVALGDSFTEGLEDDVGEDGRHRGWADRVAAGLAVRDGGIRYANLAVRGKLLRGVVEEQLPVAEALTPDLVSFHAGPNDLLRPRVDLAAVLDGYEAVVRRFRATGAEVLLLTMVGPTGWSGRAADVLIARIAAFNERVRAVAAELGCAVADVGAEPVLLDRRLWHEDRIHLAPEGHSRVAAAALEALGVDDPELLGGAPGWWRSPLPAALVAPRRDAVLSDVRWAHRHLLPWVVRRLRGVSSGDGLAPKHPALVDVLPARRHGTIEP